MLDGLVSWLQLDIGHGNFQLQALISIGDHCLDLGIQSKKLKRIRVQDSPLGNCEVKSSLGNGD